MNAAAKGQKALEASDYRTAIEQYTIALKESPASPSYLIRRSTAYLRNKQTEESLADAERAVIAAKERGKRELIIEAQFRRGCALFISGRSADAVFVLNIVKRMDEKHKQADMWFKKAAQALEQLSEEDEERQVTVQETPDQSKSASNETMLAAPPVQPPQTPADKIRYEWYQSSDSVYFTLLAKGVPKEKTQIDITPNSLSINFPLQNDSSYDLTIEPLFAKVAPAKSTPRVTPHKIEIVLVKAQPGQKWAALESAEQPTEPQDRETLPDATATTTGFKPEVVRFADPKPAGPSYPTSSKSGPKDWDKIATGGDEDEVQGDEADHFFKKLFKGASPDVQRAMMKSYTESNGTALSTNWDEVSKGLVETLPPDGMEAKKWS